jgi:hypothetical protein
MFVGIASLFFLHINKWRRGQLDYSFGFRTATGVKTVGIVRDHGQKNGLKLINEK